MARFDIRINGDTDDHTVHFTGEIKDDIRFSSDNGIETFCDNAAKNFLALANGLSKKDLISPKQD